MAGPGTGKSRGMMRRIARLLSEGHDPRRILAVTFTRNAADSLKDDLRAIGVAGCDNIKATTLHGLCFSILNREAVFAYHGRHPRPLMIFEERAMLQDLKSSFGGISACEKMILAFGAAWAKLQNETPGWPQKAEERRFRDAFIAWLRFHRAIHLDELIPLALDFLRNNPEAPERSAYDHVVVDEYQDLNKAEQMLISLLVGEGHCAVVGDVDQSIYGFRHAHPAGILSFHELHGETEDMELVQCWRCPKKVVALSDALIRHNHPGSSNARLEERPENPDGEVRIVQWPTVEKEIEGAAKYIKARIDSGTCSPSNFMVLSPSKKVGLGIRDHLVALGVEAYSFYTEDLLNEPEAQESFALLTLLAIPDDRPSLRYLLGCHNPSFLPGLYARLRGHCENTGTSPRDALEAVLNGQAFIPGIDRIVERYRAVNERLEALGALRGMSLIDALYPSEKAWSTGIRNILGHDVAEDVSAEEIRSRLVTSITHAEVPEDCEYVRVMSLHKSKGLKSKYVIIVGIIQRLLPRLDGNLTAADQERHLQEQRRLFYVGMTRATDTLVLSSSASWPKKMALGIGIKLEEISGFRYRPIASQFISELGPGAPDAISGENLIRQAQEEGTRSE